MVILLLITHFLSFHYFYTFAPNTYDFWAKIRLAFTQSLIVGAVWVYVITEVLSFFNLLSFTGVTASWAGVFLIQLLYNHRHGVSYTLRHDFGEALKVLSTKTRVYFLLGFVLLIVPLIFLAVYVPPKNIDSINYHLARIQLWLQNGNVAHFGTIFVFQLYNNVLAEFIQMHVFVLSHQQDYFIQLVQFSAMLGSVCVASLIARALGLSRRLEILAGVLQFSIPIGLLESTTTQNDYVACFFFLCFVYHGVAVFNAKTRTSFVWMILSLLLGGYTKYTVFVFALPFCVWIGWRIFRQYPWPTIIKKGVFVGFIGLGLFGPFLWRNYQLFGHIPEPLPSSPLYAYQHSTERKGIACTLSGLVKNTGLHLGLPYLEYNQTIDNFVSKVHEWLGVSLNDGALSLDDYSTRFVIHEDMAGNFIHFLLIICATVAVGFLPISSLQKGIVVCAWVGFILFCTMLKFQLWSSRTHLPFFSVGSIIVAMALGRTPKKWTSVLVLGLLLMTVPYIYANSNKSLLPIRSLSKYLLGYIPNPMCVKNLSELPTYKKTLDQYYDFSYHSPCFYVKGHPSYLEKLAILRQLDNLQYFQYENESVFNQNRWQLYFSNDFAHQKHRNFLSIARHLALRPKGIGVIFTSEIGFYHYWSMLKEVTHPNLQMQYVYYHPQYATLPNEQTTFEYDYILTDNLPLVKKQIPSELIEATYITPSLQLVKLKNIQSKKHLY
ncbi:MAG: hypothetical protein MUE30_01465 [Spirosomaceae bacterium]|nr:hypothetical protein [Spirosomataceae bacterium]